ncbi:MAG: hypothetical protein LBP41_00735 [Holosporaceae bacterium]|jgi:hypothetical protein|nr:hypothetical protein [Holosporaceae bacterium]
MTDIPEKNNQTRGQNGGGLDKLKDKWPSPFVSRDRISEFTDGILKQSSMNTMDARGDGICPRYRIGNRVFYEVDNVIKWLKARTKTGGNYGRIR